MTDTHVNFQGVYKSYDGRVNVLKDLQLEVERGEFLTLLGPSGSGKTTTLMILAGLEEPTAGDVTFDGRSILQTPPFKRGFGVVFQNYMLFPHMSVGENVAFPLRVRHVPAVERSELAKRALDLVGLHGMLDRMPAQLSGGQQQRVALARALVYEPPLVLMDEPLGALDKQLREQMQFEIKAIHRRIGTTFVYVTHDQQEALTMSDRVAVFNDGVIQQLASPDKIYEQPDSLFVARFVGESNELCGKVAALNGHSCTLDLPRAGAVNGTGTGPLSLGETASMIVRPESIVFVDEQNSNHLDTTLSGTVAEMIYRGDRLHLIVTIGEDQNIFVTKPNIREHRPPVAGETVRIGWSMQDGRIYG